MLPTQQRQLIWARAILLCLLIIIGLQLQDETLVASFFVLSIPWCVAMWRIKK